MLILFILCSVLSLLGGLFHYLVKKKIIKSVKQYSINTKPFDFLFLAWIILWLVGITSYFLLKPYVAGAGLIIISSLLTSIALLGFWFFLNPKWQARKLSGVVIEAIFFLGSLISILVSFGMVMSLLLQSLKFFKIIPISQFLFTRYWDPVAGVEEFGSIPIFWGTFMISIIAITVAIPLGIFIAIYLSNFCQPKIARALKPLLELLAGVPTVVYGFFAILVISPFIREIFAIVGVQVPLENAMSAGIIMGIAITPIISSLSYDTINSLPKELKEASLGLGATLPETITRVLIPSAMPGIMSAVLIAMSRAVGETMIVVMAAGLTANLSLNPLSSLTTATVQIVTLLTGDNSFDSPQTLSAFALGLMLFIITLGINGLALRLNKNARL